MKSKPNFTKIAKVVFTGTGEKKIHTNTHWNGHRLSHRSDYTSL